MTFLYFFLLYFSCVKDKRNSLGDMVRQCLDALEQIQNMSLLEIRGDRDQVLGRSSLKCLNLVPRLFSALPPVRWEKTLVWAGHAPPTIWDVFDRFIGEGTVSIINMRCVQIEL